MKLNAESSLNTILSDPTLYEERDPIDETTLTIWVPVALKERYKQVQRRTNRKFAKKLREIVEAAIDLAEKRAG